MHTKAKRRKEVLTKDDEVYAVPVIARDSSMGR
jgi:hypothetical protein